MMADAAFLSIREVSHRYRGAAVAALADVSLDIARGRCFGLLGPNGAGKSTLLTLLMGLRKPQSGSIRVGGHDVATAAAAVRGLSALVPQDFAFYGELTCAENLQFFADVQGVPRHRWPERRDDCVRICGLESVLAQRAALCSGGMKRRLNLAIGLLGEPEVLYLDEPTVGIDALSRQVILAAIRGLRDAGRTLIYTSHYMEEVESICDDLAIINHGRVVARGTTAELLAAHGGNELQIEFTTAPDAALAAAFARWAPRSAGPRSLSLSVPDAGELTAVLDACARAGLTVRQLQFGATRLEQRYLELLQ